jgi:NAD+-dependent protein deacetylase sirtuin 4
MTAPLDPHATMNATTNTTMNATMNATLAELAALLDGRRAAALVGAGLSTDSGIPDYRGAGRAPRNPIQHREFMRSEAARRRYWARSFRGWPRIAAAEPNAGHRALAALEAAGRVNGVITQNVDGLHQRAGSRRVVELHGALGRVRCLGCGAVEPRAQLQERMTILNDGFHARDEGAAPDGDAELDGEFLAAFVVPACAACGGILKPDVVFFGDNVAPAPLADAWSILDEAGALLVLGSSLAVWSGFRFARKAAERGLPIAIVNLGPTRADALAAVRLDAPLGDVLPRLAAQ